MSELKKNFVQGKMNKDFDVRLIPEGEYIDAQNVLVSNSEGSSVGSIQNSFGLDKLSNLSLPNDAETIGSCSDEGNECIYWAVTSSQGDYIYEYDQLNGGVISVVIGDERTQRVLNFSKQHKITGFNVIYNSFNRQKLLVWTDDLNEIRCINVKRAKGYGVATNTNSTFESKDISLYKKQPHFPPNCTPTTVGNGVENNLKERFLSFGYRWKYLDGEYSAISTFSNPQFYPSAFALDYNTNENNGMINFFNAVNIGFNVGDKNVTDVQLLFKESNSNTIWIIETFNKEEQYWLNDSEQTFTFSNNKIYSVLPEDEVFRLFDNVPLRAKAQDFIGNRLIYGNYVEGRNMVDSLGIPTHVNYDLTYDSESLNDVAIPSSIVSSTIDSVSYGNILEIDFTGKQISKGDLLNIHFRATSQTSPINYSGKYVFDLSVYLTEDHSNALALQVSDDFTNFINVIANTNFQNYDTGSIVPANENSNYANKYKPFEIVPQSDVNKIQIKIPYIEYQIDNTPYDNTDADWSYQKEIFSIFTNSNIVSLSNGNAYTSVKTNRSYEAGIVYLDDFGRYSTVITNKHKDSSNNCFIPISVSDKKNNLKLEIKHRAPYWAKKYKVFVKDSKLDYQTFCALVVYKEENHLWIRLEGQDKNKVAEGDFLIIKRNINGVLQTLKKVEVLEYKQQSKGFLEGGIGLAGNYIRVVNSNGLDLNSYVSNTLSGSFSTATSDSGLWGYLGIYNHPANGVYFDIPIKKGSKIIFHIQNEKYGEPGIYYDKTYTAQDDYNSFQEWFLTEANSMGPFGFYVGYTPLTLYGTSTVLYNAPYIAMLATYNGNGQHSSFFDGYWTIIEANDLIILETDPKDKTSEVYYETPDTYLIENGNHLGNAIYGDIDQFGGITNAFLNLTFFNCYTQGNGVESYRVKDLFSGNFLSTNTRPNAAELDGYKERKQIASLTYGGGYDKNTNYNSLNEFNLSRANFKDLDDKYGSIQKIFSRDTDLIVFQEDKLHRVLYNKNLLSDAVGGGQITSVENVLGQEIPIAGEYGIGIDPEGFSYFDNNIYFPDQPKGVILRLGADGLTPISMYGMRDWFRDNLREYKGKFVTAGYDPSYDNYIFAFTDEDYIIDDNDVSCNQNVSNLNVNPGNTYNFNLNMNNKVGDVNIKYDIVGGFDVVITMGRGELINDSYSESGTITFNKEYPDKIANVSLTNNTESVSSISLVADCPQTPELLVTTLVVNDSTDVGKTMRNKYTWVDNIYGYSGESSIDDVFGSSGLTRFLQQTGNESDGAIPFEGSTMRVTSKKLSGEFTPCNKIGYIITSDDLDAQEIIDNATYPSVTTSGDENYIEFTYTRGGDLSKKLYIVWDYIDNVYTTQNNILKTVTSGSTFTMNALDNVFKIDPYTISIITDVSFGSVSISGDYITYINNGTGFQDDFFVYRVSSGDCYEDIRVDIKVTTLLECYTFDIDGGDGGILRYIDCFGVELSQAIPSGTITQICAHQILHSSPTITTNNTGVCEDVWCRYYRIFSSTGVNTVDYIDCDGIQQTISVDGSDGYVEDYFYAIQLIGLPINVQLV